MTQISLGQLFLQRREAKNEIGELESKLNDLGYHREDQPVPEESYTAVFQQLENKREYLFRLDTMISECNNVSKTVVFKDQAMTLNNARHLKTHLTGAYGSTENQIRRLDMFAKRQEQEMFFDATLVPPAMRPKKFSYVILADLKALKDLAKNMKKDISTLDSLIQKADWSITVEAPQE